MSFRDTSGRQLDPADLPQPDLLTDVGTIIRAICHDDRHSPEERARLASSLLDLTELAGLRDAP